MKKTLVWLLCALLCLNGAALAAAMQARQSLEGLSPEALHNAGRAATAVNGYYLPFGSRFSLNEATGPRTEANGYVEAEDSSGEWMPGGGADVVATAVYRALNAGGANVDYESLSFSSEGAVRVNDAEGLDFSFFNYESDLSVELYLDGPTLCCAIAAYRAENDWNAGNRLVGSARLSVAGPEALYGNIALACGSVNDTTLGAGDVFSFNAVVGPCAPEYGYLVAPNGQGQEAVGGGVDAVASALYLAVKDLDCVRVEEKATYGGRFNQGYVRNPQDAVLVDAAAGIDFSFVYTGRGALAIYIRPENGGVACEVYETTSW